MNIYAVEAYADTHNGRVKRRYIMAASPRDAAEEFHNQYPAWLIRNMWERVPFAEYDATPKSTEENQ